MFRADPSVLGRVIRIEGVPVTIVGIGPANHRGTARRRSRHGFLAADDRTPGDDPNPCDARSAHDTCTLVRESPSARRRHRGAGQGGRWTCSHAGSPPSIRTSFAPQGEFALGTGITVVASTDVRIHPQADAPFMALASLVLVIVGLVLAIACSNLATLLLVRGAARAKEVSVRLAMGATRRQLVRHLLTESLLLALAGGIAGCILAWWGIRALQGIDLPFRVDLTLDYRVLAFAIALSLVTGVVFGLAPALKATRVDLLSTLRDEGLQPIDHRRLTLKNGLIVFQVAVSVLLLGGTSIFLQMAAAARALRVGYAVDGVAMLETDLRFAGYSENRHEDGVRRASAPDRGHSWRRIRGAVARPADGSQQRADRR